MADFFYDLHIHSCLSPCAQDDMSPANIAGMAHLCGLQIVALTDHNTCGNCEAFMEACARYSLIAVPGMELTTAEEIHMVCLFANLQEAMAFDREVSAHRLRVKNKPEIFGRQLFMDSGDGVLGEEEYLLPLATDLSLEDAYAKVLALGGAAYPAHVDREANGILAVLGAMPPRPRFEAVEFANSQNAEEYSARYGLTHMRALYSSDAHSLWDIQEAGPSIRLEGRTDDAQYMREALVRAIRGEFAQS